MKITLPIIGLSCGGGGALSLERVLRRMPGVLDVYTNPATENAYIDYDPECITPAAIADKIRELGYETEVRAR